MSVNIIERALTNPPYVDEGSRFMPMDKTGTDGTVISNDNVVGKVTIDTMGGTHFPGRDLITFRTVCPKRKNR